MRIDLHAHSRVSDGTDTPTELVENAKAAGLDVVAITDHDTTAGWLEASAAAIEIGVALVPGIEISTQYEGRSMHLLAYLPDPTYGPLVTELSDLLQGRTKRVPTMVGRLRALGVDITVENVWASSEEAASSGRPHVADALVDLGVVKDRAEAFDRYLAWGRPAYVDKYDTDLVTMLGIVTGAGGVAVLAHPWGRSHREWPTVEVLAELRDAGLSGIEVDHQDHDASQRARLRGVARELDLVVTGSSDYHGTGKVDHELGVNTTDPEQYERLLAAARRAAAASPDVHPARVVA